MTSSSLLPPSPPPAPPLQQQQVRTSKYANAVYPLSKPAYEALKQSIKAHNGLYIPIAINESGDVLDGHHRLQACKELGIEPTFEVMRFDNDLEEEIFVYEINRARRHLTPFQNVELTLKEKPLRAKLAELNMKAGTTLSRNQERVHVDKELAKKAKVSKDTLYKVEQVCRAAEEHPDKRLEFDYDGRYRGHSGPTYAQLRKDARDGIITPSKAFNIIKRDLDIKAKRAKAQDQAKSLHLPNKLLLLNADSTKGIPEIQDNSVDLIVTDPPYIKEHLALFDALANFAVRKLKEGGSLVFYYSTFFEPEIHRMFAQYADKLTWWWRITVDHESAGTTPVHARIVRTKCKPMMWFVKGKKRLTGTFVTDYIQSTKPDKDNHPWAQSETEAEYLIKLLTISEDALVVDPFLGSGAFAIPAIKLGRYFIGIELDKDHFENAKNHIKLSLEREQ